MVSIPPSPLPPFFPFPFPFPFSFFPFVSLFAVTKIHTNRMVSSRAPQSITPNFMMTSLAPRPNQRRPSTHGVRSTCIFHACTALLSSYFFFSDSPAERPPFPHLKFFSCRLLAYRTARDCRDGRVLSLRRMFSRRSLTFRRRVRRAGSAALGEPCRRYTPIFRPAPPAQPFAASHGAEEARALWRDDGPVKSQEEATRWWLRFGNNPVVHSAMPAHPAARGSPFSHVEDYAGTNLVSAAADHRNDSLSFWLHYYEQRAYRELRLARRTASSHLGAATAAGDLTDEADQPHTPWERDTYFKELLYLSERHLKRKAGNLMQLERALWFESAGNVPGFLALCDATQQQRPPTVPFPSPSVWFLEGEARQKWAETFLPANAEALAFFLTTFGEGGGRGAASAALLDKLADQLGKIHAVLLARHERQLQAGICPAADGRPAADADALLTWCESEAERHQRGIEEGHLDPEDLLDDSEEWRQEHARIEAIAAEDVGRGCTYALFWRHALRREELETIHVLADDQLRSLTAAARSALLQETALKDALQHLETSLRRGTVDLRAAVFQPYSNATWCKLNYAKFGGSAASQHTHAARRRLLFHYAPTVEEVAAAADLYFATKPLSSAVDYASPYQHRRSLAALCARFGVEQRRATQRPFFASAAALAAAESNVAAVCRAAAAPFGAARRAYDAQSRAIAHHQHRLLPTLRNVRVHEVSAELLEAGDPAADDETALVAPPLSRLGPPVSCWPRGARRAVRYNWEVTALQDLALARAAGPMTAERALELQRLRASCRLEVSLWRRRTVEELASLARQRAAEENRVAALLEASPALRDVHTYATSLFERVSGSFARGPADADADTDADALNEGPAGEWCFVALLRDAAPLSETSCLAARLPLDIPDGTYRLRVRGYALNLQPVAHAGLCSEAFSDPFEVYDAVTAVLVGYVDTPDAVETGAVRRGSWMACCRALREAGVEVPLGCEFEAGQALTGSGDVPVKRFLQLLNESCVQEANASLTPAQLEVEPRCRAAFDALHPGASDAEWASARYDALAAAAQQEREWFVSDPLLRDAAALSPAGVVPGFNGAATLQNGASVHRYGLELCALLTAGAASNARDPLPLLRAQESDGQAAVAARCVVNGSGEIRELVFEPPAAAREADVTLEGALMVAEAAVRAAQDRHAVLSMQKLGPMEKELQVTMFCGVDGLEMGGKYARTYAYALERAKAAIQEGQEVAGRPVPGVRDDDKERVSEGAHVDRFASATHPEQRKTRFAPRVTLADQNMEDPTPDQESTWGR
eukprot:gene10192-7140_t